MGEVLTMRSVMLKLLTSFGFIGFFAVVLVHHTDGKPTTETLEATVIAYDIIKATTPCYRDCEGSLIVRINTIGNQNARYARVDFRFRNGSSFSRQLIKQKRLWRFSVVRTNSLDEPIYEYIVQERTPYSEEKKYPIWKTLPGAEDEKVPFEQLVPSYSLIRNQHKLAR